MIWNKQSFYTKDSKVEECKRQSDQHSTINLEKSTYFRGQRLNSMSSQLSQFPRQKHSQKKSNQSKPSRQKEIIKSKTTKQLIIPEKKSSDSTFYTYNILGKCKKRRINFILLRQKVEDALRRQNISKEPVIPEKQLSEGEIEKDDEPDQHEQFRKHHNRYFDGITQQIINRNGLKCFRCGKQGHFSKNCLQQKKIRCYYCLGHHQYLDCNSRSCFRCGEIGHVYQECKAKGEACLKCQKIGHTWRECGSVILRENKRNYKHQSSEKQWQEMKEQGKRDLKNVLSDWENQPFCSHFNCSSKDLKQSKEQRQKQSFTSNNFVPFSEKQEQQTYQY